MNRYNKQTITKAISDIEEYLKKHNIVSEDIVCSRLMTEEIILNYTHEHECDAFGVNCKKKSGKLFVTLSFSCESFNIFEEGNDFIVTNLKKKCALNCSWEYKGGKNIVVLQFEAIRTYLNNLLYLRKYLREEKLRFGIATFLQICSIALCVLIPVISAKIIETFAMGEMEKIIIVAAILLAVNAVNSLLEYTVSRLNSRIYNRVISAIETDAAKNVFDMEIKCIEDHGSGMFIQRMTSDAEEIAMGFENLSELLYEFVEYIGVLGAMLIISPVIFAIKVVGISVLVFLEIKRTDRLHSDKRGFFLLKDEFTDVIGEMVHGCKDIKLLNSEKHFIGKLSDSIKQTNKKRLEYFDTTRKYILLKDELSKVFEFLFYAALAVFTAKSWISASVAIVFFNYSLELIDTPTFAGEFLEYIKSVSLSSERLYQLINNREFTREKFGTLHPESIEGSLEFRDVTFSYNNNSVIHRNRNILNKMSFTIKEGETVAFVGKSGCGKSTALNLVTKLFNPTSGTVLLGGYDMQELDKDTIRKNVIAITQFPYIFNVSVKDNIRLIKPDATDEQIEEICKKVCLHEEIMALPEGYDTIVGESGIGMSGGQRQRLALARSLVSNTNKIIIFDEATSALDNTTQERIQKIISGIHGEKTVIIVAHRLSTIKNCDRIFFFSEGRVLAEGTHGELLENCEEYRKLYSGE